MATIKTTVTTKTGKSAKSGTPKSGSAKAKPGESEGESDTGKKRSKVSGWGVYCDDLRRLPVAPSASNSRVLGRS